MDRPRTRPLPDFMARPPTIFKRSANLLLQHIASHVAVGDPLPTEQSMAELGEGSRTAIRSVLAHFHERGLISDLKDRRLLRKPVHEDYFDLDDLRKVSLEDIERFMKIVPVI